MSNLAARWPIAAAMNPSEAAAARKEPGPSLEDRRSHLADPCFRCTKPSDRLLSGETGAVGAYARLPHLSVSRLDRGHASVHGVEAVDNHLDLPARDRPQDDHRISSRDAEELWPLRRVYPPRGSSPDTSRATAIRQSRAALRSSKLVLKLAVKLHGMPSTRRRWNENRIPFRGVTFYGAFAMAPPCACHALERQGSGGAQP